MIETHPIASVLLVRFTSISPGFFFGGGGGVGRRRRAEKRIKVSMKVEMCISH